MEQEEFFDLLDQALEGKSLEEIEALVRQVKDSWMALYLEDRLRGYFKCRKCGRFSLLTEYTIEEKEEADDKESMNPAHLGSIKRYYRCPKCGKIGYEARIRNCEKEGVGEHHE